MRYSGSVTVELDPLVALDARVLDTEALEHVLAALDVKDLAELRRLVELGRAFRNVADEVSPDDAVVRYVLDA
jgi:hypothetical protein